MRQGNPARLEKRPPYLDESEMRAIRAEFPALSQKVHGHPLVYLDSAATALKPQTVIDAVTRIYSRDCANIHRGVHLLSQRATEAYEAVRDKVRLWVHAPEHSHVIFVRGTTEAINLVADAFVLPRLESGDEVVITELEHHSNIVPWQLVTERAGANLVVAPINGAGEVDPEIFRAKLTPRTKFVSVAHVSNALGTVLPVKWMIEMAHQQGIPVMVDGAQAVAHVPVDLTELDADFYAFSAHKLYGPTGSGALIAKTALLEQMRPYQAGGDMIKSVSFEKTLYNDLPHRFEAGTPDIAGVVGMGAAIDFVRQIGISAMVAHERELLRYATERLAELPAIRFFGTAADKAALVSFNLGSVHPHDVGTVLDMEGIAIRAGHHCAQPVMKHFGQMATVRASFGIYNNRQDVDRLIEGLYKVEELFS
ncbi:MAG: cysteine desulfurase [Myxococcales bacterium]|nr:cysteine desulfurase [Myxococcales bacterium]